MEMIGTCLFIFLGRMLDVSLGSFRIIFLGKGKSLLACVFGFCEIFIWFLVARNVLSGTSEWWYIFPYSFGYAAGTYIGSLLNEKFVGGNLGVQVVTSHHDVKVLEHIRSNGYAVSAIDVQGKEETSKYMLFIEIDKKHVEHLKDVVKEVDPTAFLVVSETKYVQNGYFK